MEPLNFQQICRVCLGTRDLVPIFETLIENEMKVSDMISLLQLEWHNMDLPQNICSDCISELYRLHTFSEKASRTELILKRALKLRSKQSSNSDIKKPTFVLVNSKTEPMELKEEITDEDAEDAEEISGKVEPEYYSGNDDDLRSEDNDEYMYQSDGESVQFVGECEYCNEIFESYEDLQEHEKNQHAEVECQVCHKKFAPETITYHMATHSKEKPLKCFECNKEFWNKQHFKRHMMVHTGERPYRCEICGKGFIQWTSMQKHKNVHQKPGGELQGKQTFDCSTCGRTFKRILAYNYHLRKHGIIPEGMEAQESMSEQMRKEQELRTHICEICGKGYKNKYLLKAHTAIHGEKKFICNDCGKGFISKPALQAHHKIHTGEKPHKCAICGKSFAHISTFDSHALIHTGVKPYACKHCPKTFTQPSHLNYHMRVHSGERPFKCQYCQKAFALKGNLVVHERTHTGETPYVCDICDRGFYDSSSMKKHRRGHVIGDAKQISVVNVDPLRLHDGTRAVDDDEEEEETEVVYDQNGQFFIEAVEGFE